MMLRWIARTSATVILGALFVGASQAEPSAPSVGEVVDMVATTAQATASDGRFRVTTTAEWFRKDGTVARTTSDGQVERSMDFGLYEWTRRTVVGGAAASGQETVIRWRILSTPEGVFWRHRMEEANPSGKDVSKAWSLAIHGAPWNQLLDRQNPDSPYAIVGTYDPMMRGAAFDDQETLTEFVSRWQAEGGSCAVSENSAGYTLEARTGGEPSPRIEILLTYGDSQRSGGPALIVSRVTCRSAEGELEYEREFDFSSDAEGSPEAVEAWTRYGKGGSGIVSTFRSQSNRVDDTTSARGSIDEWYRAVGMSAESPVLWRDSATSEVRMIAWNGGAMAFD